MQSKAAADIMVPESARLREIGVLNCMIKLASKGSCKYNEGDVLREKGGSISCSIGRQAKGAFLYVLLRLPYGSVS